MCRFKEALRGSLETVIIDRGVEESLTQDVPTRTRRISAKSGRIPAKPKQIPAEPERIIAVNFRFKNIYLIFFFRGTMSFTSVERWNSIFRQY